jgi:hypothetical protein
VKADDIVKFDGIGHFIPSIMTFPMRLPFIYKGAHLTRGGIFGCIIQKGLLRYIVDCTKDGGVSHRTRHRVGYLERIIGNDV